MGTAHLISGTEMTSSAALLGEGIVEIEKVTAS